MNTLCTLCLSPIQEIRDPVLAHYELTVSPCQGYFYIQLFEISSSAKWGQKWSKISNTKKNSYYWLNNQLIIPFHKWGSWGSERSVTLRMILQSVELGDFNINLFFFWFFNDLELTSFYFCFIQRITDFQLHAIPWDCTVFLFLWILLAMGYFECLMVLKIFELREAHILL